MKNKTFRDTVILNAGHAMIKGHKPNKITLSQINEVIEKNPQDLGKFGLFDNSSPNYTTYYPDVTADDLKPSDDEFIEPIFRMLSNVTVHAKFNPIYFPVDVLKKSMTMLIGQTINVDHETATGNAIGAISAVEWQEAYKDGNITVPAGINAVMKIDGKSNPRIARGIMMEPPAIHSNSVTVSFEWVKSHPEMDDDSFWSKLGTFDKKGTLIQRIVTKVLGYHETSLVGHGADPFAQKIKDGKIINPKYAKSGYPLSEELPEEAERFCNWDWKTFEGTDFISNNEIDFNINNEQNSNDMEILRLLESIFGLEANSLTEENHEEKLKGLKAQFDQFKETAEKEPEVPKVGEFEGLEAIQAEFDRLTAIVKDLPVDLTAQLALAKTGGEMLKALRDDTTRLYKLTIEEGKEDASILGVIASADYTTLKALNKQYDELTDKEFSATCSDCGSHNITRASASSQEEEKEFVSKSSEEVIEHFVHKGKSRLTIFGNKEEK